MNGKPVAIPNSTLKAAPQIVYLEGATKIVITR